MDTVLTLNVDQEVIQNVENYASSAKKTVPQLVEEYLLSISAKSETVNNKRLGPITGQLTGIIKLNENINTKKELENVLREKYL